ncbi:MAG: aspartate aminotransferase [Herbaspirillum sp.]|nr:aspartate aminotransferase [Herbaspirillum sp.]
MDDIIFSALSKVCQSYSVAFADYVRACEKKGQRIVKLQTGDPDFPTHPNIISAAHDALLKGETKYCDSRGLFDLRGALASKLLAENNIKCSANDNILITHGAVHGIGMAIRALVNPGDECVIIEPYWRAYEMDVILAEGIPIIVQTTPKDGFQLVADRVIERFTPRTKLIILNTPNNPSGAVYGEAELRKLVTAAAARGIYVISDEVYESIVFQESKHFSIASNPDVFDWVISAFSFSKTHAMTGWRIGYIVASKNVIDEILKLSQFSVTSLSPFTQMAGIAALHDPEAQNHVKLMRNEYEKRRERIIFSINGSWLEEAMILPQGAFYSMIDVTRFGLPSLELAKKIVDVTNVSFTPGIAFGDRMDGYLRMCFATSDANIDCAINALLNIEKLWRSN